MAIVITPNMNLPVPVVGQEAGPQYAIDINNCMTTIDSHGHTAGAGVPITTDALNINADLPINSNRLMNIKSAVFASQGSPLPGASPDLNAVYVSGVDLYYNDGAGNQVRITQGGSVTGGAGGITGLTPPASASYVSAQETFFWQSDVNQAANMDFGAAILRNLTPSSKGITLQPPVALAADYTLTLPAGLQAFSGFLTVDTAGNISNSAPFPLTNPSIANNTIQRTKLAPVGEQVSGDSGSFNTSSTVFITPTNLTITITTSGRPVMLLLQPSVQGSGNEGYLTAGTSGITIFQRWFRDGSFAVSQADLTITNIGDRILPGGFNVLDTTITGSPGTYTYEFQVFVLPGQTVGIHSLSIVAYEL